MLNKENYNNYYHLELRMESFNHIFIHTALFHYLVIKFEFVMNLIKKNV